MTSSTVETHSVVHGCSNRRRRCGHIHLQCGRRHARTSGGEESRLEQEEIARRQQPQQTDKESAKIVDRKRT